MARRVATIVVVMIAFLLVSFCQLDTNLDMAGAKESQQRAVPIRLHIGQSVRCSLND